MPEVSLLISALLLGLLSSGHCLGMCGGLMAALSTQSAAHPNRLLFLLSYNLGRICSYAVAGLLMGSLGWVIANSPAALLLRTLAALLLIGMGLYMAGWGVPLKYLEQLGHKLWRYLQPFAARVLPIRSLSRAFIAGMLWGWLPCGLVYSSLLWAASQGDSRYSLWLMLAFGLGTCPALLVTGFAAERLKYWLQQKKLRWAAGLLIIIFGLWSLPEWPHQHGLMGHE